MEEVVIDYTNWRGIRSERKIVPRCIAFGSTEHHPDPQWLLVAEDVVKGVRRIFAMNSIHSWRSAQFSGIPDSEMMVGDKMIPPNAIYTARPAT